MHSLELNITTSRHISFREEGYMVLLPTIEGQIGVLYGHIPMLTSLAFGMVKLLDKDSKIIATFYIDGGAVQITNTAVNILCSCCADASALDKQSIENKINLLTSIGGKQSKLEFYNKILKHIYE